MPKNDTKNTKTTASHAPRTGRQATLPPQPRRSSPPPARRTRTAQRQEPAATRASSSELAQLKADYEAKLAVATTDLQRMRADFENYQKRVASEKRRVKEQAETATILKLLPVVDIIERAASHVPKELQTSALGKGLAGVEKNLAKALKSLDIERIAAAPGTPLTLPCTTLCRSTRTLRVIPKLLNLSYKLVTSGLAHQFATRWLK